MNLCAGSRASGHGGYFKREYSAAWTEWSKSNSLLTFCFAITGGSVLRLGSGELEGGTFVLLIYRYALKFQRPSYLL